MGRSYRGPRQPGSCTAFSNTRALWTSECLPAPLGVESQVGCRPFPHLLKPHTTYAMDRELGASGLPSIFRHISVYNLLLLGPFCMASPFLAHGFGYRE